MNPLKTVGKFEVPHKLPSLNQVNESNRANRYAGNKMKQETENDIAKCIRAAKSTGLLESHYEGRVVVMVDWWEPNNRRDVDNVKSANKFVLDALVKTGILTNDGPKYVKDIIGAVHYPMYDNPTRVERVNVRICKEV